jgi:F-type H+-transporting ATPase subunit epsilon
MGAQHTLHVRVITAERQVFEGEADMVVAPGSEGQLGILPRHAPLLTTLAVGELRIKLQGEEEALFVAGGFMEVRPDSVTVLADDAEAAADIDEARAEAARRRAQELLQQRAADVDQASLQAELQRAVTRLKVAEQHRRRRGGQRPVATHAPE